jgi:hypothetical protein
MESTRYPQFFEVDDVLVRLDLGGDTIRARNSLGSPFPLAKVISEGRRISEAQYLQQLNARQHSVVGGPPTKRDWKGTLQGSLIVLGIIAAAAACFYLVAVWPS